MYFPEIPNSFIYSCTFLCWRDVLWGYQRKLIGWEFVVEIADFYVSNGSVNSLEVDLICFGKLDIQEIESTLYSLAEHEDESLGLESQKKWLFIALKWLFENKDNVADPLGVVELIYEDFDFPFEIESFVRYMPPQDGYKPGEHSSQQNIERLFCNWQSYLEGAAEAFKMKV
ncbi:DUF2247 family protein [Pseudomonas protegens]|uniref:DUF2247 family protein n=1 Tax=Pseudomonas chlororaphis group TaxID=136842 RepID=UPI003209EE8E